MQNTKDFNFFKWNEYAECANFCFKDALQPETR